jgi:hypothetical protein
VPRLARCIEGWVKPAGYVGWVERSDTQQNRINTVGGSPTASYLSCLAKKGNPKKSPPVRRCFAVPCVARLVRRLRNSRCALRQSSPKPPDQPALLGGTQGKESQNLKPQTGHFVPTYYCIIHECRHFCNIGNTSFAKRRVSSSEPE